MSKKIILLFAIVGATVFSSCEGPEGPQGQTGYSVEAEVFELFNLNFGYNDDDGYNIYQTLNPRILDSDVLLIYRLVGTIDPQTPIWEQIPNTRYLDGGREVYYDFDFSKEDFKIYAGGNFNLATEPDFINNQTFRIVIIPGYFSNKGNKSNVDLSDYNAVIKAYKIDESKINRIN